MLVQCAQSPQGSTNAYAKVLYLGLLCESVFLHFDTNVICKSVGTFLQNIPGVQHFDTEVKHFHTEVVW
jgi:hypothetical protein